MLVGLWALFGGVGAAATGAEAVAIAAAYPAMASYAGDIVAVAHRLGIRSAWLANVINFESRGNPQAYNPSGATGIIQFISTTARELGTTTDALRGMTGAQQMAFVDRYFRLARIPKPLRSQLDVFMAVYYPAAVGKGPSYAFPQSTWAGNPGIRVAGDYYAKAMKGAKLLA